MKLFKPEDFGKHSLVHIEDAARIANDMTGYVADKVQFPECHHQADFKTIQTTDETRAKCSRCDKIIMAIWIEDEE